MLHNHNSISACTLLPYKERNTVCASHFFGSVAKILQNPVPRFSENAGMSNY